MLKNNPLKLKKYDNPDAVAYGRAIKLIQKESANMEEKQLTAAEKNKKEDIIMSMKDKKGGKDKLQPADYAAATSQAKKLAEDGEEIAKKNMDMYKDKNRLTELIKAALMGPMNEKKQRPDYPDIDGDGDTEEPMVKAAKDKEKAEANESFDSLVKKVDKSKGYTKKEAEKVAGSIAAKKRAGAGKGPTAKQKKRMAETILKELRGSINEMAGEDLELKSLAKKMIPILKKYGMRVDYETDTKSIEMKPKVGPQGVPAKLLIRKQDDDKGGQFGMLTVAVYWLELVSAKKDRRLDLQELDMGSGPSKQDYKDADEMANKIYKELMAVVPKGEFDSITPPKMNKWGNYLIHFRLKK